MLVNGQAVIRGGALAVEPHAVVECLNHFNAQYGSITADAGGAFELSLPADAGNTVECWQKVDHLISDSVTVVVPTTGK
jgi:hypothetical protein